MQWAIELGEFHIQYQPRTVARGQVLANFVNKIENQQQNPEKLTLPNPEKLTILTAPNLEKLAKPNPLRLQHIWTVHVDGSSNKWASGAEIVLISPD